MDTTKRLQNNSFSRDVTTYPRKRSTDISSIKKHIKRGALHCTLHESVVLLFFHILLTGHVDPGESDMETALRETKEEAGLVASDLKIFEDAKEELKYDVGGQPKIVIYWLAELLNQDKPIQLSAEHQAFKWLRVDEACSVAKYQEMQHTLKSFHDYIHKNIS